MSDTVAIIFFLFLHQPAEPLKHAPYKFLKLSHTAWKFEQRKCIWCEPSKCQTEYSKIYKPDVAALMSAACSEHFAWNKRTTMMRCVISLWSVLSAKYFSVYMPWSISESKTFGVKRQLEIYSFYLFYGKQMGDRNSSAIPSHVIKTALPNGKYS